MASIFDPFRHTFITHPSLSGVLPIILGSQSRVWVYLDHSDKLQPGWVRVSDGLDPPFDQDGTSIVSISQTECQFYTDQEAERIASAVAEASPSRSWMH